MGEAKIRLSQTELELVTSADLILTKNAILHKAKQLLENLQEEQQAYLNGYSGLPGEIRLSSHKISKGENYKGLPYFVLDHPRVFKQNDILAIRTLFWWGNFFSTTLHLAGIYKRSREQKIIAAYSSLTGNGICYCINEDQWEHHFDDNNYIDLKKLSADEFETSVRQKPFIKLANKIPLEQWDDAGDILFDHFRLLAGLLGDQAPSR